MKYIIHDAFLQSEFLYGPPALRIYTIGVNQFVLPRDVELYKTIDRKKSGVAFEIYRFNVTGLASKFISFKSKHFRSIAELVACYHEVMGSLIANESYRNTNWLLIRSQRRKVPEGIHKTALLQQGFVLPYWVSVQYTNNRKLTLECFYLHEVLDSYNVDLKKRTTPVKEPIRVQVRFSANQEITQQNIDIKIAELSAKYAQIRKENSSYYYLKNHE